MTLLVILGVIEILWSFKLVLERKKGKEIPELSWLEFLEKFWGNNFALLDAEDNTSGPLNRGGIVDFPLLRTLLALRQKSLEPIFWKVMDSFVLLAYAGLAASRTLLQRLLASELYFRIRRFVFLVQMKKVISMNCGSSASCWKPWWWVRLDLIFSMRDIYIHKIR